MFSRKELIKFISRQAIKVLVVILLVVTTGYFLKTAIIQKRETIARERQATFILSERENVTRELVQQVGQYRWVAEVAKQAVLPVSQIDNLIEEIATLATRHNLKQTLKMSAPAGTGAYRKVEYNLTAEGRANNIITFLTEIENLPYFIGLTQVNIDNRAGNWPEGSTSQIKGFVFINPDI